MHPRSTVNKIAEGTENNYYNTRRILNVLEAIGLIDSEGERNKEYFIVHKEIKRLFPIIYRRVPPTSIKYKEKG